MRALPKGMASDQPYAHYKEKMLGEVWERGRDWREGRERREGDVTE